MKSHAVATLALLSAILLAGCTDANDGYSQQRAINSDISASLNRGPTASRPGFGFTDGSTQPAPASSRVLTFQ
jgi:uncharacterized lipoprotein